MHASSYSHYPSLAYAEVTVDSGRFWQIVSCQREDNVCECLRAAEQSAALFVVPRSGSAAHVEESSALEACFRVLTQGERPATKDCADSYPYAFAETADLHLVTFDQALRQKGTNVL